jgi:hypothetical protein
LFEATSPKVTDVEQACSFIFVSRCKLRKLTCGCQHQLVQTHCYFLPSLA